MMLGSATVGRGMRALVFVTGDWHGAMVDPWRFSEESFPAGKSLSREDYVVVLGDFDVPLDPYENGAVVYGLCGATRLLAEAVSPGTPEGSIQTDELTDFLDGLEDRLSYRHWYFGHFHDNRELADGRHTILFERIDRIV